MSRDPHDPVVLIDHERHGFAVAARNFAIYEEILELLVPRESSRLKPIAGTAISDGQNATTSIASDKRRRSIARHCIRLNGIGYGFKRTDCFDRKHPTRSGRPHLSWNRQ